MQTAYEQLHEQVERVAELRREYAATVTLLAEREDAFKRENAHLIDAKAAVNTAIEQAEHALKTLTVSHFQMTGEPKPVKGVEVKVFTTLEYPLDEAFAWASAKELAIKPASLDVKAFEKVVAALPVKPEFVRVVSTPRAQIATDLNKVLGAPAVA